MKKKSSKFKDLKLNNQGQALVEYILILVVTVGIVLTISIQVFKPLQFFLKDFMGTYVQCLLDTGELPALGGTNRIKDDDCTAKWSKARQASGLSPNASDSSEGGKGSKAGEEGASDGSNAGFYAGSKSRSSPFFRPAQRSSSADSDAGKKSVVIAVNGSEADKFFRAPVTSQIGGSSGNRKTTVSLSDISDDERKRIKKPEPKSPRIIASGENFSKPKQKYVVNPPKPKPIIEKEEQPFEIGYYLKILLIACIIIVLVLLIGGQALRLSKSWEK